MFLKINDLKINYETSGEGHPLVLLHGWGSQLQTLMSIRLPLEKKFKTFSIDLPGFGKSDTPKTAWNTTDYADVIRQFLHELHIINPIIIGHSFGGKIVIQLASSEQIHKMILIDSACCVRAHRNARYLFKVLPRKLAKKIIELITPKAFSEKFVESFKKRMGSQDYRNASGIMREILIKTVNDDLRSLLPNIKTPTLLFWGENDQDTPVSDGKLMETLIPKAKLIILKKAGHYSYLDQFGTFMTHLDSFLNEDFYAH